MIHAPQTTSQTFSATAHERLTEFLKRQRHSGKNGVIALTPDASTREYFRIPWKMGGTAVAAVYPEPFDPEFHPFLDVTRLFSEADLPVPKILSVEPQLGLIIQEDLGDNQLIRVYEASSDDEIENYKERAIHLIAKIQSATAKAYEKNSICSRLAFDEAKLAWELSFFFEHYFVSLRGENLSHGEAAEIKVELNDIAAELAARPRVLCHRDYHAANIIIDRQDQLRLIDYQDARMGPASYDLVSLLLDRQTELPSLAEVRAHRLFFLEERRRLGLEALDPDDFAKEFRLMTVQRNLKAIGTFSYQTAVCGRGATYAHFIKPMFSIVLQAIEWLNRFPALRRAITERINEEVRF